MVCFVQLLTRNARIGKQPLPPGRAGDDVAKLLRGEIVAAEDEKHEPAHARIAVGIEERGRGRVAKAPDHHVAQRWDARHQPIDSGADVFARTLERSRGAAAITHAAIVEAKRRDAGYGELARKER